MTSAIVHVDAMGIPINETMKLIEALWIINGISPEHSAQPLIEVIERLITERRKEMGA